MSNRLKVTPNDLSAFWMPFTANRQFKQAPRMFVSAKDMHYTTQRRPQGARRHRRPVVRQCRPLPPEDHRGDPAAGGRTRLRAGLPDGPPRSCSNWPTAWSTSRPKGMDHVFFTNSGSESVETALKIAIAYHRVKGEGARTRLIGRERGYHGVNFGGISVGGIVTNRKMFGTLLGGVDHMPHTHLPEKNAFTKGVPEHGAELANELERIVALHDASTIAAVIVEPVAGSTGVLIRRRRAICRSCARSATKHGILLIFDEVITGFGRLGTPFAADYFGVTPDIMTTAKGVTNGVIPMGAVFVKKRNPRRLHDRPRAHDRVLPRLHLFGQPDRLRRRPRHARHLQGRGAARPAAPSWRRYWDDALHSLKGEPHVIDIRNIGLVGAIELAADRRQPDQAGLLGLREGVRARRADPHHRRHHRAVAAADHHQGPDQRADRPCARSAAGRSTTPGRW